MIQSRNVGHFLASFSAAHDENEGNTHAAERWPRSCVQEDEWHGIYTALHLTRNIPHYRINFSWQRACKD